MPSASGKPAGISVTHVTEGEGLVGAGVVSVRVFDAAIAIGVAMIATAATPPIAAIALLRRRIRVARRRTSAAGGGVQGRPGSGEVSSSGRGASHGGALLG